MMRFGPCFFAAALIFLEFALVPHRAFGEVSADEIENAKTACDQDIHSFCAGVDAGGGRLIKCLVQRKDDLQSDCRTALDNLRAERRADAAKHPGPCAGDTKAFCSGVAKGEGRIAACLKQHVDQLQPGCKTSLSKAETKP